MQSILNRVSPERAMLVQRTSDGESKGASSPRLVVAALLLAALALRILPATAQEGIALPAPAIDLPAGQASSAVMVVAGGCFWGVQGVFQHVKGVSNAVSGYAGGAKSTAVYELTNDGTTGHAESVQITYDPKQVTYGQLLQVFFSVAHDPTQLNRQGPDTGTQYRSTIFAADAEQAAVAKAYIAQLDQAQRVQEEDCDDDRGGPHVLPGREVSPGFSRPQSHLSVHRLQRPAED